MAGGFGRPTITRATDGNPPCAGGATPLRTLRMEFPSSPEPSSMQPSSTARSNAVHLRAEQPKGPNSGGEAEDEPEDEPEDVAEDVAEDEAELAVGIRPGIGGPRLGRNPHQ